MAKKEKRISINALEKIAEEQFAQIIEVKWQDLDVTIKRTLPMQEMLLFVKEVTEACFLEDGTFVPEIMEFAIKSGVLTHYANFNLPSDLKKQYWLIYNTDAANMIYQHINLEQFNEIVESINRKIDHMCDTDIASVKAELNDLNNAFGKIGEQFSAMFDGIDTSDLQRVIEAVGDEGVNEEKIVSAYVEHMKQNLGEGENDK